MMASRNVKLINKKINEYFTVKHIFKIYFGKSRLKINQYFNGYFYPLEPLTMDKLRKLNGRNKISGIDKWNSFDDSVSIPR